MTSPAIPARPAPMIAGRTLGCGEWGFRELPMEDHFRIARDLGFADLEFGIGGGQVGRLPEEMTEAQVKDFIDLGSTYGLRCTLCCIENDFTLPDADAHARMLRQTQSSIELAAKLGATHVRLFAGFTPAAAMTEPIWQRLTAALRECDALCARWGMLIAIETHGRITHESGAAVHEHTVSTEPHSLRRLLSDAPPRVGINFDPGNLKAVAPNDRDFCLDLLNERINYCHLKDWRRRGRGWEAVAPGDDDLDYAALLPRLNFDGVYLIEYEPTPDVIDGIRRSLAYFKSIEKTVTRA